MSDLWASSFSAGERFLGAMDGGEIEFRFGPVAGIHLMHNYCAATQSVAYWK